MHANPRAPQHQAGLDRRRFLRRLAGLAAWLVGGRYDEALGAEASPPDSLGPVLPRRSLGRTGEQVTMLGLGGFHVGSLDDRRAQALVEAALEQGIRFFDTAPQYQERVFLMTKTLARDGASARRDLDGSLRRLRTDYLDLWQMHALDSPEDVERRWREGVPAAMAEAKQRGKVRHLGFTGHRTPAAHLRALAVAADQFEACQMPINAADPSYRSFIRNVLPVLVEKRLGVLAMKTLADQGFFGRNRWDRRPTGVSPLIPDRISVREALHFVWSLPVSTLITGAESLEQLHEKVGLARSFQALSAEERRRIVQRVADLAGNAVEYYKA